jgi:hypothetical protein
LKKEIIAILLSLTTLLMLFPVSFAQPQAKTVLVSAWVDKTWYEQGETGTLYITVLNKLDHAITIHNITIKYESWYRFVKDHWEGNETIEVDTSRKRNEEYYIETTFTVPSDSRGVTTRVAIEVYTDQRDTPYSPSYGEEPDVNVAAVPWYFALKDMDKLMSLITVQVILTIICTIILAATIFLSKRKTPVVWKKEPKTTPP